MFDARVAFKPFDYPEVQEFKKAISHSFWLVSEWNFLSDVQDFSVRLTPPERAAICNALLAISQVEVSVKRFWTRLGDRFPKAEFEQVGVTFGESEVRHSDAYSHLLEVLGLNADFEGLLQVPAIRGRVEYLTKYLKGYQEVTNEKFSLVLALFTLFIENVSLFSQFLVIKSFNKHKNLLKDVDNVVSATMVEEALHAQFGVWLINKIREEHPGWFTGEWYGQLSLAAQKAGEAECLLVDWMFEQGELSFLPRQVVKEFIKKRLNDSLVQVGGKAQFAVDPSAVAEVKWLEDELLMERNTDVFHKRPTTYTKKVRPVRAEDIF